MSLSGSIDQSFLPNLPGFRAKSPKRGQKAHYLSIVNGDTFVKDNPISTLDGFDFPDDSSVQSIGNTTASRTKRRPVTNTSTATLTFQAFFEEDPFLTNSNARQIRKCNIYFYVEDGKMKVVEKPQLNSGVSQGTLVKRSAIPKPDGTSISEHDLVIGNSITVYGRTYKLVDCDAFTRNYLKDSLGMEDLGSSQEIPTDSYNEYRMSLQPGGDDKWGRFHNKPNDNKRYIEAKLGHNANNQGREGFIKYGNQCLRFKCIWDNRSQLYGDLLYFTLSYYLADNTVEIISAPQEHDKNQNVTKLLKRAKLPKSFAMSMDLAVRPTSASFFHWSDLSIGMMLEVFGRHLEIIDADQKTRDFYDKYDLPLGPEIVLPQPEIVVHKREIPPPTGFGSEEDSMRSVSGSLLPGPAPAKKLGENRILSFFCSLLSGGIDDVDRRFVISLYLQDHTIKVVEPPVRNSGFTGGLFLSRREVFKTNGELMKESDIYVGRELPILKHRFLILQAPDSTLRWMEDKALPFSDVYRILDKIRPKLLDEAKDGSLAKQLRQFETPEGGNGCVTKEAFAEVLRRYDLINDTGVYQNNTLIEHELITLQRGNGNKNLAFNYEDLISELINPTNLYK